MINYYKKSNFSNTIPTKEPTFMTGGSYPIFISSKPWPESPKELNNKSSQLLID